MPFKPFKRPKKSIWNYDKYFNNIIQIQQWLRYWKDTVGYENWTQLPSGVIITFKLFDVRRFWIRAETSDVWGDWVYIGNDDKAIRHLSRTLLKGKECLNQRIDTGDLIKKPDTPEPENFYYYAYGYAFSKSESEK